ncbi:MAG TPA: hypothetical protein VH701_13245, partial [Vicinamibacterales bacterium]
MSRHLIIPFLVLTAVATSVSAQEPARTVQRQDTQTPVFSSRAELVVVHVTVKDRRGAYATGLPREAFRIIED